MKRIVDNRDAEMAPRVQAASDAAPVLVWAIRVMTTDLEGALSSTELFFADRDVALRWRGRASPRTTRTELVEYAVDRATGEPIAERLLLARYWVDQSDDSLAV